MSLDEFSHLWDGTDPDWSLNRFDRVNWVITFHIAESGPQHSELLALKKLVDELRDQPTSKVLCLLRGTTEFTFPREVGNIELREIVAAARKLGLNVKSTSIDRSGYLAVHADGTAMIIEDNDLAAQVYERMLAAGVPVTEIHVD
jgi:hypothetical protein